jgi:hypothetical protein
VSAFTYPFTLSLEYFPEYARPANPTSTVVASSNLIRFILCLLDLAGINRKRTKQVNLMLKAYYSHIPVSQEYFWMVDRSEGAN